MDSIGMIRSEVLDQLIYVEKRMKKIEDSLEGIPDVSRLNGMKIAYTHILNLLDIHTEYQQKLAKLEIN